MVVLLLSATLRAAPPFPEFVDPNPNAGNQFGHSVVPLSTGNVVITSPFDDASGLNAGAVYLFNGATGALISTLRGSSANNNVGLGGVTVLVNGNYVVSSSNWDNGAATNAGAVTWGSGTSGVSGVVSSSNSLIGSKASDQVGGFGVTALGNGNYVVRSYNWDNGAAANAGAVTWGNGTTGVSGVVSSSNSLVGSKANDFVGGGGVVALNNGNYVVVSSDWDADTGAVTWGSGTSGVSGVVSSSNSLVGSTAGDYVGRGVIALGNGNYVVRSYNWSNGATANVGAVTWGSGTSGVSGVVNSSNSLIGSSTGNYVGSSVVALSNSHYVVISPDWDDGATANVGAVTWGSGSSGVTGTVSSSNSLAGSTAHDRLGGDGVVVLSNGNYVVRSSDWDNGTFADAGAVTWCNGSIPVSGMVSSSNSLVGSKTYDFMGRGHVTALSNGNYVVSNSGWDNGATTDVGAVTWCNGSTGLSGVVSASNSLVGSTASNQVGYYGAVALSNGHYLVLSPVWDNGATKDVGALTWCNGSIPVSGMVSSSNSLVGSTAGDQVGYGVRVLNNGNYVVISQYWDNGVVVDAGAVTWGSGTTGITGVVSSSNSLIGSSTGNYVGSGGMVVLSNGHYVVSSPNWDNGALTNAGAVTWGSGTSGVSGAVSSSNSLVGLTSTTNVQPFVVDAVNGTYFAWFRDEGSGRVRLGSVADGLVPNVTSLSPSVGLTNGGDSLIVTGRGFTGATAVSFGGIPATSFSVVNYNTLSVTTPAHIAGMVNMTVTTPQGTDSDFFTYNGPEMNVTGNGFSISDGGGGPLMYDHTDFGIVLAAGGTLVHTFTIQNTGVAQLSLTGTPKVVVGGPHAADFTVTSQPASPLGAGASTTFQVSFDPGGLGLRSATLSIANDDSNENPYDIAIQGTGDIYTPQQKFDAAMTTASLSGPDAQPSATPKKDGVANLLKYAFNMGLTAPDRRTLVPGTGTAGLPSITRVGGILRIEYLRRIGSGLIYTPQKRMGLDTGAWLGLTSPPSVTAIDAYWERAVHEEPFTPATTPRLYGRVEVTLP